MLDEEEEEEMKRRYGWASNGAEESNE